MDPILLDAIEYNGGGINTLLNRGAVKSIQRGFGKYALSANAHHSIPISKVNIDKAFFWFTFGSDVSFSSDRMVVRLDLLGENIIIEYNNTTGAGSTSLWWQIVEFY